MKIEFKLNPIGKGDLLRVQGCDMSVYDGLGDRVSGDSRLGRTGVSKLACGLNQSAASFL